MASLSRIFKLKRDLRSRVMVSPEESHWEHPSGWVGGSRGGNNPGWYENEGGTVIDKVAEYDRSEESHRAEMELREILTNSHWYNFVSKYFARKALSSL